MRLESLARLIFLVGAACQAAAIFSEDYGHLLAAFCIFECIIGMYWPTIGTLRAKYIAESVWMRECVRLCVCAHASAVENGCVGTDVVFVRALAQLS